MESVTMAQQNETAISLSNQYVTFQLGGETYGISILKLNEIIAYQSCTTIPNVPSFIKGVLNLRGIVVPVIDLRERFGMDMKDYDQFTVIMILDVSGRIMGLVVDAVSDVITLNREDVKPRPHFSNGISTEFIAGMGIKDNKFVILLDVDKVLSDEELNMVDGV
ncbi:MAG TPA: chemotaxis protein CheW [Deltaproteobacteria bacterium]|jgi:purine-binding chemotaxis protein CheW|nr:purine-binding chemotaxis protein CheW [Deltaproteobacteria bacterium]OQC26130.1 MAG: Chemotaxis protein CheW [Deltaproteobacteria bacterium ADurb.Bin072]HRW80453.1 chemotaxis protein CheW [Desulfomonilia bacterium]NMD39557.1 purine-binding chemotaxis protein CheW [Deltaproteobacteria bacterium]HNS89658.1 chemotaxis protein CheW [Deltaproteobacteria bacterium]